LPDASGLAEDNQLPPRAGAGKGELALSVGLLALALVVLWQTLEIPVSPIYARVGPTIIPMMTAIGLVGLSVGLIVVALRGGWQPDEERAYVVDGKALAWLTAGLLANILLIGPAGFTAASVVMFALASKAFGSTRLLRDAGIGLAFALTSYFGFAKALGINIGAGAVERALEALPGLF